MESQTSISELVEQFRKAANKWMAEENWLAIFRAQGLKGISIKTRKAFQKDARTDKDARNTTLGDYIISRRDKKLATAIDKCIHDQVALQPALKDMADKLYQFGLDKGMDAPNLLDMGRTPFHKLWTAYRIDTVLDALVVRAGKSAPAKMAKPLNETQRKAVDALKRTPGISDIALGQAIGKADDYW